MIMFSFVLYLISFPFPKGCRANAESCQIARTSCPERLPGDARIPTKLVARWDQAFRHRCVFSLATFGFLDCCFGHTKGTVLGPGAMTFAVGEKFVQGFEHVWRG